MCIVALEVGHIAHVRASKGIDGLIIVADGKDGCTAARQQSQPAVLQGIGILELVDQNVLEATLIMLAYGCVALQQLIRAQQQFGKIDHTLAFALVLITLIDVNQAATVRNPDIDLPGALAFFLATFDKTLEIKRGTLSV